jgi:hypothetical protein
MSNSGWDHNFSWDVDDRRVQSTQGWRRHKEWNQPEKNWKLDLGLKILKKFQHKQTMELINWKIESWGSSGNQELMIIVKEGNWVCWLFLSEKTTLPYIIFYLLKFLHQMWEQQLQTQETLMDQG